MSRAIVVLLAAGLLGQGCATTTGTGGGGAPSTAETTAKATAAVAGSYAFALWAGRILSPTHFLFPVGVAVSLPTVAALVNRALHGPEQGPPMNLEQRVRSLRAMGWSTTHIANLLQREQTDIEWILGEQHPQCINCW